MLHAVLATMMVLFVLGERLPTRVVPPMVAMIATALALLVGFAGKSSLPTVYCATWTERRFCFWVR
jgi:hypothetical protein